MSSKSAAARGTSDAFFDLLALIARAEGDEKLAERLRARKSNYKRLYYMQQKGYIAEKAGSYVLSSKARKMLSEHEVWQYAIPKPRVWDKKWRLVLFDIPKDRRKRRDIFRLRLKELGLVLYQDSVWVHPFPLAKQVSAAANFYGLSNCVSYAIAEALSGEASLKKQFRL